MQVRIALWVPWRQQQWRQFQIPDICCFSAAYPPIQGRILGALGQGGQQWLSICKNFVHDHSDHTQNLEPYPHEGEKSLAFCGEAPCKTLCFVSIPAFPLLLSYYFGILCSLFFDHPDYTVIFKKEISKFCCTGNLLIFLTKRIIGPGIYRTLKIDFCTSSQSVIFPTIPKHFYLPALYRMTLKRGPTLVYLNIDSSLRKNLNKGQPSSCSQSTILCTSIQK